MRALAALLLTAAGVLTGLLFRERLQQRVRMADALCRMGTELGRRMLYLCEPLPQITQSLCRNETYAALPFLRECADRCRDGVAFPCAWQTAAERFQRAQRLSPDRLPLASLGASLAAADARQIENLLALYGEQFRALRQSSQDTLEKTGKLLLIVCGAVGVLLGILIL